MNNYNVSQKIIFRCENNNFDFNQSIQDSKEMIFKFLSGISNWKDIEKQQILFDGFFDSLSNFKELDKSFIDM